MSLLYATYGISNNYEVDPAYFEEKYGMPVGERRNAQPILTDGGDDDENKPGDDGEEDEEDKKKQSKNAHPGFFD